MNFDRIFNPTVQEQIEDLKDLINTLKVLYNERCAFCKHHSDNDGQCNIFGRIVRQRCLLYDPDTKLYEKILKMHTDKLEKLKRGASENE